MTFQRTEPSGGYRTLRFVSGGGRWELGFSPYRHGMRLRMGLSGRPPSVLDFCLGYLSEIYAPVLLAVIKRLETVPESASAEEIDAVFPWAGTRPDLNLHLGPLLGEQKPG